MKAIWFSALCALLLAAMGGCGGQEEWPPESDRARPRAQEVTQSLENTTACTATLSKQSNGMSAGLFLFDLEINEPITLQIDVETTSGWLDMALKGPDGKKVFDQDKLRGAYEVDIQKAGTYQVNLKAGDFYGRFAFTGPYPGAVTTEDGGTDLNVIFDPPELPPLPESPPSGGKMKMALEPVNVDTKDDTSSHAYSFTLDRKTKFQFFGDTKKGMISVLLRDGAEQKVYEGSSLGALEAKIDLFPGEYAVTVNTVGHTGYYTIETE